MRAGKLLTLPQAIIFTILICSFLIIPTGCSAALEEYSETVDMWGTFVTITVYTKTEAEAISAIEAAFSRMQQIGDAASIFDANSQAFQLNRDGHVDQISPDLKKLVEQSLLYFEITDGAFDITVQPVLDAWSGGLYLKPEAEQEEILVETLKLVGSDKILLSDRSVILEKEGMKITLGGITKGYAASEVLAVLREKGIKHAMISVGGDISTLGTKPDGTSWQVALTNPDDTLDKLAVFSLKDTSIATSGNYERYFSPDKRIHHIINPKTGFPVQECISVTIITTQGLQADVLATSVFVMGPEKGMALVESLTDVEAFIVDSERVIHLSSGMGNYLIESRAGAN